MEPPNETVMELGRIIEFERVGEHLLGAVIGTVGKRKLIVLTRDGVEMRPRSNAVTFVFDEQVDASSGRDGALAELARLEELIDEEVDRFELEELWKRADPEADAYSAEELTALLGDEVSDVRAVAVRRMLRDDEEFFRPRKRGWEPRTAAELDELRDRRERAHQRRRDRVAFVNRVAELLDPHLERRTEQIAAALAEADFRNRLELLQDYACYGAEVNGWREAADLLDSLEDELGHPLRGAGEERAFWVNVELGLWSEHERVSLRRFREARSPGPEAAEQADSLVEAGFVDDEERSDFTDWWTCTIDDPGSRDLDDALSVRPRIDGGWQVAVHIADPSTWVTKDSALDQHAYASSTSVYLPTGVIPMFPRDLTEKVMSLEEGVLRPALTTLFEFSPQLERENVTFLRSKIIVDRRLDYATVDQALTGGAVDGIPTDALTTLRYIADEFHMRRLDAGAIDIGLPETKLLVDLSGRIPQARVSISDDSVSRGLVGEMMIAVNEAVAEFCADNEIPTIYRVQEPPDGDLSDDAIMSVPEGYPREFARLKRMRRGTTSTEPGRHSGLGVDRYVQTSSPIRRYVDLVVQRQIKAHLAGLPLPYDDDDLDEVIGTYERASYEASRVERDEEDYWMTWLLGRADGTVTAEVIDYRDEASGEATVFLTDYGYRASCQLRESVPLGTLVELDVTRADPRHGALSLREARSG